MTFREQVLAKLPQRHSSVALADAITALHDEAVKPWREALRDMVATFDCEDNRQPCLANDKCPLWGKELGGVACQRFSANVARARLAPKPCGTCAGDKDWCHRGYCTICPGGARLGNDYGYCNHPECTARVLCPDCNKERT